jgi:isocitrate/isopropylmalate dehydrogenase
VNRYRVVVIPGDGIGPEITEAAVGVLRAVEKAHGGFALDLEWRSGGAGEYARTGQSISDDTLEGVVRKAELARKRKGAPRDGVRRVTCVDKANVLRGFAYFRQIFLDVAESYPDIQMGGTTAAGRAAAQRIR